MNQPSESQIQAEIARAEHELDRIGARERRLWDFVSIAPERWTEGHYGDVGPVWVVAVMGRRCLYLNPVEGGWGWGTYDRWGSVDGYHWQQDEIQHSIVQTLVAIDQGRPD